jgi:hypothetical protein
MNKSEHDELLAEWRDLRLAWLRLSSASSISTEQREQAQQALQECELKIRRIEGTLESGVR